MFAWHAVYACTDRDASVTSKQHKHKSGGQAFLRTVTPSKWVVSVAVMCMQEAAHREELSSVKARALSKLREVLAQAQPQH